MNARVPFAISDQAIAIPEGWKLLVLVENETPETVRIPLGPVLVPAAVWAVRRAELIRRNWEHDEPLGVWITPRDDVDALIPHLDDLTEVAVACTARDSDAACADTIHRLRSLPASRAPRTSRLWWWRAASECALSRAH